MTLDMPMLGATLMFDDGVSATRLDSVLTLTNAKKLACIFMALPTSSDLGLEVAFVVPPNYSSAPVIAIRGVLSGTPANTLAFGVQQLSRAVSESIDTAYEAEDLANNSTWTGYVDEDPYEETITLTPAAAYVAGDIILIKFSRDESVDDTTFDFLLLDLRFQYTES